MAVLRGHANKALPDAGPLRGELLAQFIDLKPTPVPASPTNVHPLSMMAPVPAELLPRVA